MNIYLAFPVSGTIGPPPAMVRLAGRLRLAGHDVTQPRRNSDPTSLVKRSLEALARAELIIADVSLPSHGVGVELGIARASRKPCLLVARTGTHPSEFLRNLYGGICEYGGDRELVGVVLTRLDAIEDSLAVT